jgi:hypothetical protein
MESGDEIPVSALEAEVFAHSATDAIQSHFFASGGLDDGTRPTSRLAVVAAGLSHGLPLDDSLVYLLDSTTVGTAVELVQGDVPSPAAMLDLASVVFACVMSDFVVVPLHADWLPRPLEHVLLPFAGNNTTELTGPETRHLEALGRDATLICELNRNWSQFFKRPVTIEGSWSPDIYIGGPSWNRDFIYPPPPGCQTDMIDYSAEFAAYHSLNFFRRQMQADGLEADYHCSSFRFPAERVSLRQRRQFRWLADSILRSVEGKKELKPSAIREEPFTPRVEMPHLLSEALRRTRSRDGIWDAVLELRETFLPVREWMRDKKGHGLGDMTPLKNLIERIGGGSSFGSRVDGYVSQGESVISKSPGLSLEGGLILKLLSVLHLGTQAQRVLEAITRPEVRVLRRYRDDILKPSAEGDLYRLFGVAVGTDWIDEAIRLTETVNLDSVGFSFDD